MENVAFSLPLVLELGSWILVRPEEKLPKRLHERLEILSDAEWHSLLELSVEHRLHLPLWALLKKEALTRLVSTQLFDELEQQSNHACLVENLGQLSHTQATTALSQKGISVTACKGIRLAADYYPARGLRRMQDIDYWIESNHEAQALEILTGLGFKERKEKASGGAKNLVNQCGVILDLHHQMKVFSDRGFPLCEVTEAHPCQRYRVFQPEAFVAHLLVHMLGHARATGILFCWVVDLYLVLSRHASQLDWARAKKLLPENGSWEILMRFYKSFEELGWLVRTEGAPQELDAAPMIPWPLFVRQIRQRPWSGKRGFLRLVNYGLRTRLGFDTESTLPTPSPQEWLQSPRDWYEEASTWRHGNAALFLRRDPR